MACDVCNVRLARPVWGRGGSLPESGAAPEAAGWRLSRWPTAGLLTALSCLMALAAPEGAHAARTITLSTSSTSIDEGDSGPPAGHLTPKGRLAFPASAAAAEGGACAEDAGTLCLLDDRYAVSVDWSSVNGATGKGSVARPRTDDSGLFWFFSPTNWELLVKVLNGCGTNRRHWVFAASATDVGFVLTVRDTETGQVKQYTHAAGTPAKALADVSAFPEACAP